MHYELATLERLLNDTLPVTSADDLRKSLLAETDRVRLALLEVICSQEPEDIVRRNIRMHQQSLLRLAAQLEMAPAKDARREEVRLECFEQLLGLLEEELADYWGQDLLVPAFRREAIRAAILARQPALVRKLKKSGADKRLIGLMLQYKADLLAEGHAFTYRQWHQVKELTAAVERLPDQAVDGITDQLIDHLFRLQVHNESLFSFIQEKTRQDLKKIKTPPDRLFYLEGTLGHATNIVHFRHPHLAPEPGSLLALHIEWLGKMIHITQQEIEASAAAAPKEMPMDEKIITSLSKPELALMVRLFKETGVFQNKNMADVARFMTAMVSTRNERSGKKGSVDNFYQLLFKVPAATHRAVDCILDNMKVQLADLQAIEPPAL